MIEKLDTVFVHQGSTSFEPVLAHRFRAIISRPPPSLSAPNDLWYLVRRISPGGRNVDQETYNYLNDVIVYPRQKGVPMSSTITLGIFKGRRSRAYQFMKDWYKLVYSDDGSVGIVTRDGADTDMAKSINGDIKVELMSPDNEKVFSVTMKNCWPQTVRLVDLDMEGGDVMSMLEYTFAVNDWDYDDE